MVKKDEYFSYKIRIFCRAKRGPSLKSFDFFAVKKLTMEKWNFFENKQKGEHI
jgi:hypothetical protein